jgi:hypothetical protein
MAINFGSALYVFCFDTLARPITVTPVSSNPTAAAYSDMRGIYDTTGAEIIGLDGQSLISDQKPILDILEDEFINAGHTIPQQGDVINIPEYQGLRSLGDWEVTDKSENGGGEVTLNIRAYGTPAP